MTNKLQVFNYKGQQVRTVKHNGEICFVAKDVCDILGIANARDAVNSLDDDEKMTVANPDGHSGKRGGAQFINIINEPGLYKLIFRSNKPEAKRFTRWVTHEVLPQIHKYGMYLTDKAVGALKGDPETFDRILKMYTREREKTQELQKQLDNDRPFTNLGIMVLACSGSITVQAAAHFLCQHGFDIGQNRLYRICRERKLLCSRKGRQWNQPTQIAIEKGLFNTEISGGFNSITMITPRGLSYLTEMFASENYPLLMLIEQSESETE